MKLLEQLVVYLAEHEPEKLHSFSFSALVTLHVRWLSYHGDDGKKAKQAVHFRILDLIRQQTAHWSEARIRRVHRCFYKLWTDGKHPGDDASKAYYLREAYLVALEDVLEKIPHTEANRCPTCRGSRTVNYEAENGMEYDLDCDQCLGIGTV